MNKLSFDTLKVHAGYVPAEHNGAISPPLYETAAFDLGSPQRAQRLYTMEEDGFAYSRASNPTVAVLEQRLAALHGASVPTAVAVGSGMAAASYALLAVVGAGGRVLTHYQLYGGSLDAFARLFPRLGIAFDAVEDPLNLAEYERRLTPDTRALFIESLTNPLMQLLDIEGLASLAHKHGIPLIVDNTLLTPYLLNPFEHGADIVVYSATKGLSGHGTALAGAVLESGRFDYAAAAALAATHAPVSAHAPAANAPAQAAACSQVAASASVATYGNADASSCGEPYLPFAHLAEPVYGLRRSDGTERSFLEAYPAAPLVAYIRKILTNYLGAHLSPFDAWAILLGLDTLTERLDKQCANAKAVAAYLRGQAGASWVRYPGTGSFLSFGWGGTREQFERFIQELRIFIYSVNLGDARSLIVDPALTTHNDLTPQQRERFGLGQDTVRLSLGLENPNDLIADLAHAFAQAFTAARE